MPPFRSRAFRVLARGLAARCPACGLGHVFGRGVATEAVCRACGWRFERCPGHWVGGNEIDLLASFVSGVLAFVIASLALGIGTAAAVVATAVTAASSVALYRPSRGLFFAMDYLLDPVADVSPPPPAGEGDDGRGRRRGPRDDAPRPPRGRPRAPAAPLPSAPRPAASTASP